MAISETGSRLIANIVFLLIIHKTKTGAIIRYVFSNCEFPLLEIKDPF